MAMPALSAAARTLTGSMWDGSSMGSSRVSKPHFLNLGKSFTLSVTNGETYRKVFNPKRIVVFNRLICFTRARCLVTRDYLAGWGILSIKTCDRMRIALCHQCFGVSIARRALTGMARLRSKSTTRSSMCGLLASSILLFLGSTKFFSVWLYQRRWW